ncbi:MAG TPA: right-handed parallel beta-helix repeat-containing protein [Candidatus Saccharimonadales bacterium]|nr:right-handed parallel beta-helix repeat-containing protein [Candidatus Saccharimonadales bacterium]
MTGMKIRQAASWLWNAGLEFTFSPDRRKCDSAVWGRKQRSLLESKSIGKSTAVFALVALIVALAANAVADNRDQVFSVGLATRNLYLVNADGTVTSQFANYSGTASAAVAQRASDGVIYFITDVPNGTVFTWDPATPATAPVQLGTTGAAIPYFPRLAFSPGGVLYAVDTNTANIYTLNQATGAATAVGALSGVPTNLGGDIGFGPDGILYMVASTTIYTVPLAGGAVTSLGTISGLAGGANSIVGMTFDASGRMLVEDDQNPAQLYSVALPSRVATAFTGTMTTTQGDLASSPRLQISGKVFEDLNYGGGAGRSFASAAGVGRPGARVELYDAAGAFITSTVTDASGNYTLTGAPGRTYTIRVVNSTVTSSRPGALPALIGVQTFRTSGLTGAAGTADTSRVGGEDPTKIDAGNGSTTLAALTTANNTPQSITSVVMPTNAVTGIDFGFNFDTIVSTRDSGQGTLRQFLTNSNTLTNAALAQVGQTAGVEVSIFMISNGSAVPGLRAGLTNQLTGGVAQIVVTSQLPAITDANTAIDGTTQTSNVGDTNAGTLGTGGSVGVNGLSLSTVNKPEVQISAAQGAVPLGLQIQANSTGVKGLSIYGFGTAANANGSANIEIENGFTGATIQQNVLGTTATSFADPGAGTRSLGDNIRSPGGKTGTIQNNLIGFSQGKGIALESTSTGWTVQNNEIRNDGINNAGLGGMNIGNSSTATVTGNLIVNSQGAGVDTSQSSGLYTITNNTITGSGSGTGGTLVDPGVRIFGSGNTVSKNVISSNVGAGVLVTSGAATTTISQNSIFLNGTIGGAPTHEIGIDLLAAGDNQSLGTSPFVTLNHAGGGASGGNGLLNYPILQTATIGNGTLTLTGFARPGSVIEFFVASPDPSGFGQGQTYLTTLTEGSGADLDNTTGTYGPGPINGIAQGTDTTNRFKFVIPTPSGVNAGTVLTATATVSQATSEFSGNVTVAVAVSVSGKVYLDANHNSAPDSGEDWTAGASVFVNLVSGGTVVQSVSVPAGAGTFTFTNVGAGTYSIVVTNTAIATTAGAPAGFAFVNPTNGQLQVTASNDAISNQNFGLFKGSLVQGKVFKDTGNGGGTANNGILDGAEAGVSGVAVRATDGGATVFDSMLTASDGSYTLFITPGATTVAVIKTNPAAMLSTGASVGTTGGAYNRATDTLTFTKAGEGIFTGANFGIVPFNTFQNDEAQQALPGTTLFYTHIFNPGTAGQVTFTMASTATPSNVGFTRVLYQDTNCNHTIDPGEPVITGTLTTVAGTNLCIIMKVTIPPGTPLNSTDNTSITASFAYTNANPALTSTYSVRDLTTVGAPTNAGLRLDKSVDKAAALPGATLTYTVIYTNDSSAPLSNLKINDTTPAYTTFLSAVCGAPLPASLTACAITVPAVGQSGAIQWTFTGTLSPSQSGTVSFSVKIQ